MNNSRIMYQSKEDLKFIKEIGEGAYGRALLYQSLINGEFLVLKEIALANLTTQEQTDAWKEVKVLSSLDHPNIISYKGSFVQDKILNIVMEYADNGDLFEQIQNANKKHFKEEQILDWFVQICLALKHIHDRKILHRDIKCQNIFLTKDGLVKMGDFGIAKILNHTTQFSKTAIGTPYYLSPEICQGKNYNQKSDIWSLGCVLYEICTLQHAFDSNCMNGLITKILRSKQAPIPSFYSPELRHLVDSLLYKDPKKRPRIHEILDNAFIRSRIHNLLSETLIKIEFSHTIIHNPNNSNEDDVDENEIDDQPAIREDRSKVSNRTRIVDSPYHKNGPERSSSNSNIKSPSHNNQMMTKGEVLYAKKAANAHADHQAQIEMKKKKEAKEKQEKEIAQKKRQELEENMKRKKKEREELFYQHQKEYNEKKKNFESMDAPFKSIKNNLSPTKTPPKKAAPNKKSELEGTAKPARASRVAEEKGNIKEFLAKRRAEIRQRKMAQNNDDDVIQIGKIEIKLNQEEPPNTSTENNVMEMIKFSDYSDDDDEDSNDNFTSLAAMCKEILDKPVSEATSGDKRSSTGPQSVDEEDEDEEVGVFFFGEKELKLPSVTNRDSLSYRIEAIRQFIEEGLGLDKFIEIYNFVTDDSDDVNDVDANRRIHEILSTPDELSYYKLIQQLVVCEETLNEC